MCVLILEETRRGHQISCRWGYRQLLRCMTWMLGTKLGSSGKAISPALRWISYTAWGWCCPQEAVLSLINHQRRQSLTDMATGQSYQDNSLVEGPFFQVTLGCDKLTKTNQDNIPAEVYPGGRISLLQSLSKSHVILMEL